MEELKKCEYCKKTLSKKEWLSCVLTNNLLKTNMWCCIKCATEKENEDCTKEHKHTFELSHEDMEYLVKGENKEKKINILRNGDISYE